MSTALTEGMARYVELLKTTARGVPITVTSGVRTAEEQASAMAYKYQHGGAAELYKTYANDAAITTLLKYPTSQWASVITQLSASGTSLSRHLFGRAVDLRIRDLSSTQLAQLQAAVVATGGRWLLEDTPPHLHVDLPTTYALMSVAQTGATTTAKAWLWITGIGAGVIGLVALRDWLKKRGGLKQEQVQQ